jgi:ankyrin repeat protein
MFAVREGRLDVVRVLLKAGADVNDTIPADGPRRRGYGGGLPAAGTTPLLLAVKNAHFELAAALLDAGANPNADAIGYTVLHLHHRRCASRASATTIPLRKDRDG